MSKERLYSIDELGIDRGSFAPVEQLMFGASLNINGECIESVSFNRRLVRTRKVDHAFFVPESLGPDFTPEEFRDLNQVRESRVVFRTAVFNEDSIKLLMEKDLEAVFVISPLEDNTDRITQKWEIRLRSRFTGDSIYDPQIIKKLNVAEEWRDSLVLTQNEEGRAFAVFDPQLAASKPKNEV